MSAQHESDRKHDPAPGEEAEGERGIVTYAIGLVLALALTVASFWALGSQSVWGPGIPILLAVLAVAQMGVHLVFFLHITSGPENTNNTLALAFGVLIVLLTVVGSLWIMANLDANMMPMPMNTLMEMQR